MSEGDELYSIGGPTIQVLSISYLVIKRHIIGSLWYGHFDSPSEDFG